MDAGEGDDDLIRDMTEVLTSFCARLYGRRGASEPGGRGARLRQACCWPGNGRAVKCLQAFRFELDPNNEARSALASHAGAARFAFDWGLALIKDRLDTRRVLEALEALAVRQGASTAEAAVWAAGLAGPVLGGFQALRREWNQAEDQVAPWWAANSKEAYNAGLDALARALKSFFDARSGKRKGGRVGWPKFKKRGGRRSFRVTTGSFGVIDGRHVRLPRIGVIRTKEPTGKLSGRLAAGAGRVLSSSVSERAGRWFVSFTCEAGRPKVEAPTRRPVGVDVGVKCLAVLSTGEQVPNPKHLSRWQRRQARLPDRTGSPSRTGQGAGAVNAVEGHEGPPGWGPRHGGPDSLGRSAQAHHPPRPGSCGGRGSRI